MNFKEWLLDNKVVAKYGLDTTYENLENVIDRQFWICDYRLNRAKDSKPIRNVTPKLVQVFSNDSLPKNKNVYYSPIHFREIKNGKVLDAIIAPYDNTGYRAYTGVSVNIFNTEVDCRDCFKKQCEQAIQEYRDALAAETNMCENRIKEICELIEKNI